jgi:hypothetical protein
LPAVALNDPLNLDMTMLKSLLAASIVTIFISVTASAQPCPSYPYNFTSGTTAVASQINSNFASILNCANTALAPIVNPTLSGATTVNGPTLLNVGPTGTTALSVEGSSSDGYQGAQIALYNTAPDIPNPKKWIRIDIFGDFQILNNAYSAPIINITDAGAAAFPGTVTAAGFSVNGNSLGSGASGGGWTTLAGNLIIEGGQATCTPSGAAVTWPHPFPNGVTSVVVTPVGTGPTSGTVVSVNGASLTGATFYVSSVSVGCNWIAMGN